MLPEHTDPLTVDSRDEKRWQAVSYIKPSPHSIFILQVVYHNCPSVKSYVSST